jgi:N-acetylmuramoyl-L-alanine amidase
VRLIGPPTAAATDVLARLSDPSLFRDTRFLAEMFWPLWNAAVTHIIDPVGVVAQSYHETGGGSFTGRVPAWFHNTCGLKVADLPAQQALIGTTDADHPLCHAQFATWDAGATAHVQHLRAYAGWPVSGRILDPRYALVTGKQCETFEQLGGNWAPAADYGTQIVALANRLRGL